MRSGRTDEHATVFFSISAHGPWERRGDVVDARRPHISAENGKYRFRYPHQTGQPGNALLHHQVLPTPTEVYRRAWRPLPGQPIDTMRASGVDFEYYMRNDAAKRLREGSGQGSPFDAGIRQRGEAARSSWPAPASEQDARHQRRFRDPSPFRNPPTSSAWHSKTPWKSSSNSSGSRRLLFRRGHSPRTTSTFNQRINIMKCEQKPPPKIHLNQMPDDSAFTPVSDQNRAGYLRVKVHLQRQRRTPNSWIAASRSCTCSLRMGRAGNSETARPSPFPKR